MSDDVPIREIAAMERDAQQHNEEVRNRDECQWCDGEVPDTDHSHKFAAAGGVLEGPFCSEGCYWRWMNKPGESDPKEVLTCPFRGCPWDIHYHPDDGHFSRTAEERAESHYVEGHAGKARVKVTLEKEVQIGDRTPHEVAGHAHDQVAERHLGYDVAYAVAEVIEEADDHGRLLAEDGGDEGGD